MSCSVNSYTFTGNEQITIAAISAMPKTYLGGSISVASPVADGKLILGLVSRNSTDTGIITPPSGFTAVGGTGLYKKIASSEGTSYSWSSGGNKGIVDMFVVSGAGAAGVDTVGSYGNAAASVLTLVVPGITPASVGLLLLCESEQRNTTVLSGMPSPYSWTQIASTGYNSQGWGTIQISHNVFAYFYNSVSATGNISVPVGSTTTVAKSGILYNIMD